ncbi:bacillithiol biosynthesis cysteine-adding enzyme BshC [Alkalibacillus aidingensis]|uniref:bacillithiol biosynthesis cysteine-adding enzyme BshC n=1 Tax=Alkalibacillus aidingensis TaxID=2747607 RepID=UPI0016606CF1|nr:bacillithiol biosynthesis cysteine-adding enzyme BshC [Alkalibacillus aidingensis]
METKAMRLGNQSQLLTDYRDRKESVFKHFHYDPYQLQSFQRRQDYVSSLSFQRESLVRILRKQNEQWGLSEETDKHITELLDPESSVIIGGQQAGLLTGPLYTIHKIISIILQAREQREHLGKPVVPVFWIAGEDHDFLEIDHIYTYQENNLEKVRVTDPVPFETKITASKREIPKENALNWLEHVFATFKETEHTRDLYELIKSRLVNSQSYVDFFALLTSDMFKNEGLVLVDADDSELRYLESEYFKAMLLNQQEIAQSVVTSLNELNQDGYHVALDVTAKDVHLFYHHDGERLLLELGEHGQFQTKDGQLSFTESELLQLITDHPDRFSNNVVTRPLMQELVFPVLSFIAGPGEVAYWSTLKGAFHALDLQLPIVTPRLSLTLMKGNHLKLMERLGVDGESIVNDGCYDSKMNYLKRQSYYPIEETIEEVKKQMGKAHLPIQELANSVSGDLNDLAKKNLHKIEAEIEFVKKRITQQIKDNHAQVIERFDELEDYYHPYEGLQERVWNVVYWMNEYGIELPERLLGVPPRWEQDHQIIYL